ncbi:MAG: hypothetical protein ACXWQ5_06000 [Ktedonobacterales bacterium]
MSNAPRSSRKMPAAPRMAQRAPNGDWLAPEEYSDPFTSTPYDQHSHPYGDDDDGDDDDYDDYSSEDAGAPAVPLLTLPTIPALPTAKAAPSTARQRAINRVARTNSHDDDEHTSTARRPASGVRATTSGRRPAIRPEQSTPRGWSDNLHEDAAVPDWDDSADGDEWRGQSTQHAARSRQHSAARPLALVRSRLPNPSTLLARTLPRTLPRPLPRQEAHPSEPHLIPGLSTQASIPALAAHRRMQLPPRPRVNTRAIVERARSPWSMTRTMLAVLAISCALWLSLSAAGEPSQPLMAVFQTRAGSFDARAITTLVQPQTQGTRPDLYDSKAQFDDWWNAACSAAVMSEILTAWGVPHMTIGKMIDAMQPDISLNGGLLTSHGFQRGANAFGYRADISSHLTYKQLLYITNVLGLPVIVNVRINYGYYRFFDGGHFLVMTGGDAGGVKIVDSSEYYIHYLPLDTFYSMFTGITAIIVPKDYQYSMPSI